MQLVKGSLSEFCQKQKKHQNKHAHTITGPRQCCHLSGSPTELGYFTTVAVGCFSCPRVEATPITWYLSPEMQILPGELHQETYILSPRHPGIGLVLSSNRAGFVVKTWQPWTSPLILYLHPTRTYTTPATTMVESAMPAEGIKLCETMKNQRYSPFNNKQSNLGIWGLPTPWVLSTAGNWPLTADWLFWDSVWHCGQKRFSNIA